jgi:Animal haem peroxidase
MGPVGGRRQLPDATLRKLGNAMAVGGGGGSQIPAGFTYLGQFIDHDLTFDKTSVTFGDSVPPAELLQARSPSLDLDSLYGAGPADPESEKFYAADGIHLKMGKTLAFEGEAARDGFDLPRGAGTTRAQKRRAIIPDPRNDENLAVAQTHLALIRFHNRVVDTLPASLTPAQRFNRARRIVTRHYQWMIRTDFLPRICQASVVNDVFSNGRKAFEVGAPPTDVPTMPIEFSVAAYRLGHSMIRTAYNWNRIFDFGFGSLELLFHFSAGSGNLDRQARLVSIWIADFRRLYDFREAGRDNLAVPRAKFNNAMRINTALADPLRTLPRFTDEDNLAIRNLMRAKMVRLATGQQMAAFLRGKGVSVTTLTKPQLRDGNGGAELDGLTAAQRDAVLRNTPLWFYILREAELGGGKLRGVGARIVAETFHRAMEGSQTSIVREPDWRPTLGPDSTTFRMVDLLLFAFQGRKNLLAPLGD